MFKLVLDKNRRNLVYYSSIVGLIFGVTVLAYFGYKLYFNRYERSAHKDLSNTIDEFYKKLSGNTNQAVWADLERAFATGAKRYSRSNLLPYFLAFQADAAIAQNKLKEAIELMSSSVSKISKDNPIYYSFAIKLALMKSDSSEAVFKKQAIEDLQNLSQDNKNPLKDMALYYLALEYLNNNEKEKSQKTLASILDSSDKNSYWYFMAKQKAESF